MLRRRFLAAISAACILAIFPAGHSAIAMDGHAPRPNEGKSKGKCDARGVKLRQAKRNLRNRQGDLVLASAAVTDANKKLNRELKSKKPDRNFLKSLRVEVALAKLKVKELKADIKQLERAVSNAC